MAFCCLFCYLNFDTFIKAASGLSCHQMTNCDHPCLRLQISQWGGRIWVEMRSFCTSSHSSHPILPFISHTSRARHLISWCLNFSLNALGWLPHLLNKDSKGTHLLGELPWVHDACRMVSDTQSVFNKYYFVSCYWSPLYTQGNLSFLSNHLRSCRKWPWWNRSTLTLKWTLVPIKP